MATPSSSSPTESKDDPGNHPVSSTIGGASSVPTAANNVGGGKGWGDSGFRKGGLGNQEPHVRLSSLLILCEIEPLSNVI